MKFPALEYIRWAKSQRPVAINLARSGIDACPPSLLRLTRSDLVTTLPVKYGYQPLLEAIGGRYDVAPDRVFTLSGGTTPQVGFPSVTGKTYRLDFRDDIATGTWSPLIDGIFGTGATIQIPDPSATLTKRYYKLTLEP